MNQKKYIIFSIFLMLISQPAISQEMLSLEQAIEIGMKNNFSISVVRNNLKISENNNTISNAGFLPQVAINATQTNNIYKTHQEYADGKIVDATGSNSSSLTAGALMSWTVFDGFYMFIEKQRLGKLQEYSENQARFTIENVISQIIANYNLVAQNKIKLALFKNIVAFSAERKKIAEKKFELGSGSELNVLQAAVDLNTDSSALIKQEAIYQNAKIDLNKLLARDLFTAFEILDSLSLNNSLLYEDLLQKTTIENSQILSSQKNTEIARLQLRQSYSPLYPKLGLFAGYNYGMSYLENGAIQQSNSQGPTFGFTVSYPIFTSLKNNRNMKNSKLLFDSYQAIYEETLLLVKSKLALTYNDYRNNNTLVKFEKTSIKLAQKNLEIAMEKYRLGQLNDLDLRQSQLKLIDAENRLLLAQFNAKISEIELLRLSGQLVKTN